MGRKVIIPKKKDDTAGSSRKRRAAAVEKVSKRKNIEESVSESNLELKEISDYVDFSEDVAKRSVSGDSEECEGSGSNSDDGDNDSLSVSYLSRCISLERYDLRNLPKHLKYNGQLVHYLLLRLVKNDKIRHEMWFYINNKPIYFGLKEFCLITG
ncbi:hypothetical protein P3L10_012032 [Capsicum annuum]